MKSAFSCLPNLGGRTLELPQGLGRRHESFRASGGGGQSRNKLAARNACNRRKVTKRMGQVRQERGECGAGVARRRGCAFDRPKPRMVSVVSTIVGCRDAPRRRFIGAAKVRAGLAMGLEGAVEKIRGVK